jgi:hypothetical protein
LTSQQLTRIEAFVGNTLTGLGYGLATEGKCNKIQAAWNRQVYRQFFEFKQHWKKNRVLRALRPGLTSRKIDEVVIVDDMALQRMRNSSKAPNSNAIRGTAPDIVMAQQA